MGSRASLSEPAFLFLILSGNAKNVIFRESAACFSATRLISEFGNIGHNLCFGKRKEMS